MRTQIAPTVRAGADFATPAFWQRRGKVDMRVCIVRLDNDKVRTCEKCNCQPLEIDHYGQRLIGCLDCNRWSWERRKRLFMELPEEDLHSLRDRVTGSSADTRVNRVCRPRGKLTMPRRGVRRLALLTLAFFWGGDGRAGFRAHGPSA